MAPDDHSKGTADHVTACENTIACQRTNLCLNLHGFQTFNNIDLHLTTTATVVKSSERLRLSTAVPHFFFFESDFSEVLEFDARASMIITRPSTIMKIFD